MHSTLRQSLFFSLPKTEPRHRERRNQDERDGEAKVPIVVDAVLHAEMVKVVGDDAVHDDVGQVGGDGDAGAEKVEPVVPEPLREGVSLVNRCLVKVFKFEVKKKEEKKRN